ncbi:hypothetical protein NDU88_007530 [Pleurodeles waltl]|uniref:Uncharacterized protein n=1 Tax=Pleurodeles waltl TaxID=8319 RepID=A0AAV7QMD4_PLEWA|nr:hypothetical protein NDU88_007530 [Pleurodeles waltl]
MARPSARSGSDGRGRAQTGADGLAHDDQDDPDTDNDADGLDISDFWYGPAPKKQKLSASPSDPFYSKTILDSEGNPLFNPKLIRHPTPLSGSHQIMWANTLQPDYAYL